jgi:hypothetical protein
MTAKSTFKSDASNSLRLSTSYLVLKDPSMSASNTQQLVDEEPLKPLLTRASKASLTQQMSVLGAQEPPLSFDLAKEYEK